MGGWWSGKNPGLRFRLLDSVPRTWATCHICLLGLTRSGPWQLEYTTLKVVSGSTNLWFIHFLCGVHIYNLNFISWSPRVTELATDSNNILQHYYKVKIKQSLMAPSIATILVHSFWLEYWIPFFIPHTTDSCSFFLLLFLFLFCLKAKAK